MHVRLRGRGRILSMKALGLAGCAFGALAAAAGAHAQASAEEFNIPAKDLAGALNDFAIQSDRELFFATDVTAGRTTDGVRGDYAPTDALAILLADTGLTYRETPEGAILVDGATETAAGPQREIRLAQAEETESETRRRRTRRSEDDARSTDRIVVTGTHIEGVAPVGSPSLSYGREDIDLSGALSTEAFLRTVPQIFGGGPSSTGLTGYPGDDDARGNQLRSAAVNVRGLGVGATLTLLNGRRLSPSSGQSNFVDISSIPLSAIDRIEVLTDGASSIYGADAIAGVVNFILRDDYDGAETSVSYGAVTEGDHTQFRVSQTFGESWDSGNALLSLEHFEQNALYAREKSFASDGFSGAALLPEQNRNALTASLSQRLTSVADFGLVAYYGDRATESVYDFRGFTTFWDSGSTQAFVSPSLDLSLSDRWSLKLAADYSKTTEAFAGEYYQNGSLLFAGSQGYESQNTSVDGVLSGDLFSLPAGAVKVALGAAFRREQLERSGVHFERDVSSYFGEAFIPVVGPANRRDGVERLELNVSARHEDHGRYGSSTDPKVGVLWAPVETLDLRGSYGTSFNPPTIRQTPGFIDSYTFAMVENPETGLFDIQQLTLPPSGVADDLGPESSRTITVGFDYKPRLWGGDLSWTTTYYDISFDDRIGQIPRQSDFNHFRVLFFQDLVPGDTLVFDPTLDQVQAIIDRATSDGAFFFDNVLTDTGVPADPANTDLIFDYRIRNLASVETSGVDFSVTYTRDTAAGLISAGVAGGYIIGFSEQVAPDTPSFDAYNRIFKPSDLRLRGSLGLSRDGWAVSSFVNYVDGYDDDRFDPSEPVDAWTTVDLNLSYDFQGAARFAALDGLRVAASVQNVFDEDPPHVANDLGGGSEAHTQTSYDPSNAYPLGRFVELRVTKQW